MELKVCEYVSPWDNVLEDSSPPESDVTVWGAVSMLVQTTVSPLLIFTIEGWNAKPLIET